MPATKPGYLRPADCSKNRGGSSAIWLQERKNIASYTLGGTATTDELLDTLAMVGAERFQPVQVVPDTINYTNPSSGDRSVKGTQRAIFTVDASETTDNDSQKFKRFLVEKSCLAIIIRTNDGGFIIGTNDLYGSNTAIFGEQPFELITFSSAIGLTATDRQIMEVVIGREELLTYSFRRASPALEALLVSGGTILA